jgi:hypothetical protein
MRSFNAKSLGLISMAAAVLLGANGVFAAQLAGDAQMQARELLSRPVAATADDVSPAMAAGGRPAFAADPQEQARELILGTPNGAGTRRAIATDVRMSSVGEPRRTAVDVQDSARRLLIGAGV